MPRQSGSVSAGYVAPTPPIVSDLMIFISTGSINPGKQGNTAAISSCFGPITPGSTITTQFAMPVAGTFETLGFGIDSPATGSGDQVQLRVNNTSSGQFVYLTAGQTYALNTSNSVHVSQGDLVNLGFDLITDLVNFAVTLTFTPDP